MKKITKYNAKIGLKTIVWIYKLSNLLIDYNKLLKINNKTDKVIANKILIT